jgi:hypothetical protein
MDTIVVAKQRVFSTFEIKYFQNTPFMSYIVEYKLKLVAYYLIEHKIFIALHFSYQIFRIFVWHRLLHFHHFIKKRTVRLPSGCNPHGCEFSL